MANLRNRFPARRRFLKQSAALTAASASISPILALATPAAPEAPLASTDSTQAGATQPAQHRRRVPRASGEGSSS